MDIEKEQRTSKQNNALHLYLAQLSKALNDAGLDMKAVLKPEVEIPWTPENVKNHLWRPVQRIYLNKESTTELTTDEISKVYDVINRHLAKFGISVPFPSEEYEET